MTLPLVVKRLTSIMPQKVKPRSRIQSYIVGKPYDMPSWASTYCIEVRASKEASSLVCHEKRQADRIMLRSKLAPTAIGHDITMLGAATAHGARDAATAMSLRQEDSGTSMHEPSQLSATTRWTQRGHP